MCIKSLKESMLRGGQSNSNKVDYCFTAVRHIFQILSLLLMSHPLSMAYLKYKKYLDIFDFSWPYLIQRQNERGEISGTVGVLACLETAAPWCPVFQTVSLFTSHNV